MRQVRRKAVPVPASLEANGAGPKELERALAHQQDPDPAKKSFNYTAYKGADVRLALERLFHGKCAYCETRYSASAPVDIEHYRPKNAVAEAPSHGGYWWVAMDWENLLPSCIDCNRKRGQVLVDASSSLEQLAAIASPPTVGTGKKDSFPVVDEVDRAVAQASDFSQEGALLLDPCREDPAACLTYNFDPAHPLGLILPAGDATCQIRGAVSIQIYGLNRLKLVQDRTEILRKLEFLAGIVADLSKCIADLEAPMIVDQLRGTPAETVAVRLRLLRDRTMAEIKGMASDEAPYAAMAKAWLEQFRHKLKETPQ